MNAAIIIAIIFIILKLNAMSRKLQDFLEIMLAMKTHLGAIREDVLHLLERLETGREDGLTAEEVEELYNGFVALKDKAQAVDDLVPARTDDTTEEPGGDEDEDDEEEDGEEEEEEEEDGEEEDGDDEDGN